MAQYDAPTTAVVSSLESSGLDSDTITAITNLLSESSTDGNTRIVEWDGTQGDEIDGSPTQGADVVRIPANFQLTEDPGGSLILMDADAQGANLQMQADGNRAIVAGGGDDNIVFTGEGNVTVETGGGNDTIATGDGDDLIIVTGSGSSSVNSGNGDDIIKITGSGNVTVDAGSGDDVILLSTDQGAATIIGGDGFDRVILDDSRDNHGFTINEDGIVVLNSAPTQLHEVEIVEFNDGTTVIADTATKANLARLYEVLFDREGDLGGLKFWMEQADAGSSFADIAKGFVGSEEFESIFADTTDAEFLDNLYAFMAGREGDQGGLDFWTQALEDGMSRDEVAARFADSDEAVQLMGIDGNNYVIDLDHLA